MVKKPFIASSALHAPAIRCRLRFRTDRRRRFIEREKSTPFCGAFAGVQPC
jgi:hypothetical protein